MQNSQENTCTRLSFLIKLHALNWWHRCFPVNFAKFLRTPFWQNTFFFQNTFGRLLLFFFKAIPGVLDRSVNFSITQLYFCFLWLCSNKWHKNSLLSFTWYAYKFVTFIHFVLNMLIKIESSSGRRPKCFYEQDETTSDLLKVRSSGFCSQLF